LGVAVLLDTHALLWWWSKDGRLPIRAARVIADSSGDVFVSAASVSEIATKYRIGKLPDAARLMPAIDQHIRRSRFLELPISFADAELAGSLVSTHRDPFDRMLIAQAKRNALTLISGDRAFAEFGIQVIWD